MLSRLQKIVMLTQIGDQEEEFVQNNNTISDRWSIVIGSEFYSMEFVYPDVSFRIPQYTTTVYVTRFLSPICSLDLYHASIYVTSIDDDDIRTRIEDCCRCTTFTSCPNSISYGNIQIDSLVLSSSEPKVIADCSCAILRESKYHVFECCYGKRN